MATKDMAPTSAIAFEVMPVDGLKIALQASAGDKDIPKWTDRDHYYGVGALYENGPFAGILAAEAERRAPGTPAGRNGSYYSVGLSWDAECIKPMVIYQHAKNASLRSFADGALDSLLDEDDQDAPARVDSVILGATAPIAGGTVAVAGSTHASNLPKWICRARPILSAFLTRMSFLSARACTREPFS